MDKAKKTITLSYEIIKDIEKKSLNFSNWVENQYRKYELGSQAVKDKIVNRTLEIEELKKLAGNLEKEENLRENEEKKEIERYSPEQTDFFITTYKKVKKGYDINANYRLYCFEFGDSIDLAKFKKLVSYYGGQCDNKQNN